MRDDNFTKENNAKHMWHPMGHPADSLANPPKVIVSAQNSSITDLDGHTVIDAVGGLDSLSVLNHGFEKVMQGNFFKNIMESWSKTSCTGGDGKLKICSVKCGTEFDPFGSQFSK